MPLPSEQDGTHSVSPASAPHERLHAAARHDGEDPKPHSHGGGAPGAEPSPRAPTVDTETSNAVRLTSDADVATETPARYAKQLASHLGRKADVQQDGSTTVIGFQGGRCQLTPGDGVLRMHAEAETPEVLQLMETVVGSHLERFGERAGLVVTWVRDR